jgi:GTP cyclohydrolase II
MSAARRPQVTLTYAQSIDGSIAARPGSPLALSGEASQKFTHQLRAQHNAILVGIGTVLSDDPQLNVRLVAGKNPRPIILDSQLRCPTTARCVDTSRRTLIAASEHAPMARQRALEAAGAWVVRLPVLNQQIDLRALLERLAAEDIRTLMVEGGARVITSFLRARLVDRVIITIAPMLIDGVRGVNELVGARLRNVSMQQLGDDLIVSGEIDWSKE